ncbi:MAG: hypothetical protein AAGF12_37075 [Myxococcota bacterium]
MTNHRRGAVLIAVANAELCAGRSGELLFRKAMHPERTPLGFAAGSNARKFDRDEKRLRRAAGLLRAGDRKGARELAERVVAGGAPMCFWHPEILAAAGDTDLAARALALVTEERRDDSRIRAYLAIPPEADPAPLEAELFAGASVDPKLSVELAPHSKRALAHACAGRGGQSDGFRCQLIRASCRHGGSDARA